MQQVSDKNSLLHILFFDKFRAKVASLLLKSDHQLKKVAEETFICVA